MTQDKKDKDSYAEAAQNALRDLSLDIHRAGRMYYKGGLEAGVRRRLALTLGQLYHESGLTEDQTYEMVAVWEGPGKMNQIGLTLPKGKLANKIALRLATDHGYENHAKDDQVVITPAVAAL